MNILGKIEAVLFVAGDEGISIDELAYLVKQSTAKVFESMEELNKKYFEDEHSALHILEVGEHFLLSTKKEYADLLKSYAQSPISNNLSQAALETLSIIAYKQPITRVEIDDIRGVQSSGSVQKLVARHLVEEKGRVDGPGRAILYGTTQYFMDYFGLKSLEELPSISEMEEELEKELPSDLFFANFQEQFEELEELERNTIKEENE